MSNNNNMMEILENCASIVTDNVDISISLIRVTESGEEFVYANEQFFKYIGIEREEYISDMKGYDKKLLSEKDRGIISCKVKETIESGKPCSHEYQLHRPDGSILWLKRRFTVLKEKMGDYIIASVVTDISDEKDNELRQKIEMQRYEMVIDELDAAVFEWNMEDGSFYCSDAYEKYAISSVKQDVLFGKHGAADMVSEKDIDEIKAFFTNSMNSNHAETIVRLKLNSGEYHWCRLIGVFFRNEDKKLIRALGMIVDVNVEHEKNVHLNQIINKIPSGIAIYYVYIDGKVAVEYRNDGFYTMIESKRDEITDFVENKRIHPDDVERLRKEAMQAISENRQVDCEIRLRKDDNTYMWVSARAELIEKDKSKYKFYCTFSDINELKRVQEELQRNHDIARKALHEALMGEKRIRAITRNIPGALITLKVEQGQVSLKYISQGCYGITGYTSEEFLERYKDNILLDIPDRFRKQLLEYEWDNVETNEEAVFIFQYTCKSKVDICIKLKISPVKEDAQWLYYGVATRETEKEEREQQYQQFVSKMNNEHDERLIACGQYNISQNKIEFYSGRVKDCIYLNEGESYDHALSQMEHVAASKEEGIKIRNLLSRKNLLDNYSIGVTDGRLEFKRRSHEGRTFWTLKKYNLYTEPFSGDIILFLYSYNISEQKMQDQIIAKLGEKEYETLGIIDVKTKNYESKFVYGVNVLGIDELHPYRNNENHSYGNYDTIIEMVISYAALKDERDSLIEALSLKNILDKLESRERYNVSFSTKSDKGKLHRKSICFCYLDDTKTTVFCYSSDITDEYNREQEYIARLEAAFNKVKNANESKNEFYARMSHDMRTPLNAVIGLADLATDIDDIDELKVDLSKIRESGKYLLGIINDTLDIQKIESGKLTLEPQIVNCVDIMNNIKEIVKTPLENKNIKFVLVNKNVLDNVHVNVDQLRIKQIFINLLSNAIKFTPEGGTITVTFETLHKEGMHTHEKFTISDTGIGMSKEFIHNDIFRPFAQEFNESTQKYASTGLGLAIVRNLVRAMGGTISVESELGVGTTFTILMDFDCVELKDVDSTKTKKDVLDNQVKESLKGKNILIAEDKKLNAEIARLFLERVGCTSTWARDGKDCVEIFGKSLHNEYDAILMDIRMPIIDGLEAAERIRCMSRDDAKTIPIIALSANAYSEDVKKSLDAGMNAHLSKPVEPDNLYRTLAEFI